MSLSRQAMKALEAVTGSKYLSEDPAVMQSYKSGPGGYEAGLGYERVMTVLPAAVILPKTTDDVVKIVKICARYNIPYVPYATGFYGPKTHCHVDDELIIDMKRMQHFEWDEKHIYADVGPGVIYASLQQEAFNKGAYGIIGGGGAQCSAIANLLGDGWSPISLKIGLPHRRILGTELVLPEGELVKLGSLATSDDPFWGEGPGPDLRILLRGFTGLRGCLGIVTRMAIKYLPFIQQSLVPQGIAPNTSLKLIPGRIEWTNYQVNSKPEQVQAMYDIGQAEVCAACTKVPVFWRAIAKAEDKEEFWDIWLKENEETLRNFFLVRVMVIGYCNEEQFEYEQHVLDEIFAQFEGSHKRRTKPSDESWLKNADSSGMWLMTGSYVSVEFVIESMNQSVAHGEHFAALKKDNMHGIDDVVDGDVPEIIAEGQPNYDGFTPGLFPDFEDPGWFQLFENGHQGYSEFLIYWDQDEDTSSVDRFFLASSKMNIRYGFYSSHLGPHQPLYLTGPQYGPNYHIWLLKVKNEFDPMWLSHPPVPLAHDIFVQRSEWMHDMIDWEVPEKYPMPAWTCSTAARKLRAEDGR